MSQEKHLIFQTGNHEVSGVLSEAAQPFCLIVLAHGAGAGIKHTFMQSLTEALVHRSVSVFRFNFPYMEKGRKAPGSAKEAVQTIHDAADFAASQVSGSLPLFIGGKSYGGRMASHLMAEADQSEKLKVKGLVFVGFPLHAPGKPGTDRASHLKEIPCPMLFLQGGRDKLANQELIEEVADGLTNATMQMYPEGDHSFHVLKRSGTTDEELLKQLANDTTAWLKKIAEN